MPGEVFLDSAFAIALASDKDVLHGASVELVGRVRTERRQIVTTRAVLVEIGNALAKQRFRQAAARLLNSIESDQFFTIISMTDNLYAAGRQLYDQRSDKEWGMTDCISFVVMRQRGIIDALTHDVHFQQAGFRALLREELSN
jgi:uncharacterized protein